MTPTSQFTANAEFVAQLGQRLDRRNERSQDLLGHRAAFSAAGHRPIVDLGAIEDDPEASHYERPCLVSAALHREVIQLRNSIPTGIHRQARGTVRDPLA